MSYDSLVAHRPVGWGGQIGSNAAPTIRIPYPFARSGKTMRIQELAQKIERLEPCSDPREVARACLMLVNSVGSLDELADEDRLAEAWKEVGLKLQLATDQHAAVTQELEDLAASDPEKFSPDQIWILVRAIKVQGQVLQLYLGDESILDV